jgi:ring-1,2-phenylacetyl-CoA epoxidase subunit PaaD
MATHTKPTREELLAVLDTVKDPEVPVVSVVELGVVRDAIVEEDEVVVTITPTYSGCPAMIEIEQEIVRALRARGHDRVRVRTTFAPAWTTDWIGPEAREKLRAYGIAPPGRASADDDDLVPLRRRHEVVRCPYCESAETELRSEFGSTACKSIRFCNACRQPFEQFKAL